jgi:hypothetical protein
MWVRNMQIPTVNAAGNPFGANFGAKSLADISYLNSPLAGMGIVFSDAIDNVSGDLLNAGISANRRACYAVALDEMLVKDSAEPGARATTTADGKWNLVRRVIRIPSAANGKYMHVIFRMANGNTPNGWSSRLQFDIGDPILTPVIKK